MRAGALPMLMSAAAIPGAPFRECRQPVAETHPSKIVADPGVVGRREPRGIVKAAGGEVDRRRRIAVPIRQRTAAGRTKTPRHRGRRMEFARAAAGESERLRGKGDPGDDRGRCRPATGLAVTEHAVRRRPGHLIAQGAAKTSTLDCCHVDLGWQLSRPSAPASSRTRPPSPHERDSPWVCRP